MDYNKIRTFVTVADFGSITKAARHLRRSQSAISQQILALEEELELRLLERVNTKIFLSPEGEKIYALASENLGEVKDLIVSLKEATQTVEGHISLGALNDFGTDFPLGTAVGNFCRKYPNVTFTIHSGTSPSLEESLLANHIDLGILVVFQRPSLFIRTEVMKSWHSLYTSPKYLKAHGPIGSYRQLLDKALIDLTDDFMGIGTFLKKNSKSLLPTLKHRKPDIVIPNLHVVKEIIISGYGVAMLPDYLVTPELKKGKIVKLLPSAKSLFGILDVAYRTNRTLRLCERLFIKYLVNNRDLRKS